MIAADIDEQKLSLARRLGADETVDASRVDPVETIQRFAGGKGPCVCIETAGVSETQEQCLRITGKQGRVLYLGTAHREVLLPPETFERILRCELTLYGSWNSFSSPFPGNEWKDTIEYVEHGKLKMAPLITRSLPLAQAPRIFEELSEGKLSSVKVLFDMEQHETTLPRR